MEETEDKKVTEESANTPPAATPENLKVDCKTLIRCFTMIVGNMQNVCLQLDGMYNQAQEQIKTGKIAENELKDFLQAEFGKALNIIERQVYSQMSLEENDVLAAQQAYGANAELEGLVVSVPFSCFSL